MMAQRTTMFYLLALFSKGFSSVIETQQTVVASVGEEACLECQLLASKDVLQVTWQRILGEGEQNLATSNKYFGQRVNHNFAGKVEFRNSAMNNCSIVIKKVAETDEGCYRCLFNTYPEGALTGRTCLQVYELHEPVLDVTESNSPAEWLVSCSATGRPAPTVTLSVSQRDLSFSHYDTVSVSNSNATFTVTTTAVLSGSRRSSTQVGCAARVLSAPHREVTHIIPDHHDDDDDDDDGTFEERTSNNSEFNPTWIITLAVVAVVAVLVVVMLVVFRDCIIPVIFAQLKQNKTRDLEKNRTPYKSKQDIPEIKTPLINHENEMIRQRTSAQKPPNSTSKAPPSTAKRLSFEEDESH